MPSRNDAVAKPAALRCLLVAKHSHRRFRLSQMRNADAIRQQLAPLPADLNSLIRRGLGRQPHRDPIYDGGLRPPNPPKREPLNSLIRRGLGRQPHRELLSDRGFFPQ